jgi:uncharacterized cupin superfamily protein
MNEPTAIQPDLRTSFARDGFVGPLPLFTKEQCALVVRHWGHIQPQVSREWFKGWAAADRFFFDVATRPPLIALLKPLLGDDIILWAVDVLKRDPGQVHHWHTDIESSVGDKFVSIWIGLANMRRESSLMLVPGSHRYGKPIQQVVFEHGMKRGVATEELVADWAREIDPAARVVQPEMIEGDGLIFDGRLWHGTNNRAPDARWALLLQYASARQRIRRPNFKQLEWPFEFLDKSPPVLVVSGRAGAIQDRVVEPPTRKKGGRAFPTVHRPIELPLAGDPERGWRPHPIARGRTPNAEFMSVHVSVLSPGRCPHPPHAHVEEEVLVVLNGEAEILFAESADESTARVERVSAGAFTYYPAYQYHTLRNVGAGDLTYLMFKWQGPAWEAAAPATTGLFRFTDILLAPTKPYQTEKFFEQPTGYLRRLHAHMSSLAPGAGYQPHRDKHDVAIIVLAGEIDVDGKRLAPCGLFYFPAGTLHGMRNAGPSRARYLVFEFHAPEPNFRKRTSRKARRRRGGILRALDRAGRWLVSPLTRKIERAVDRRLRLYFGDDLEELRRARAKLKRRK